MAATISSKDVMTLRQRTGMGMMECKKALEEANGDMTAAVEILRKSAKGKMDERADRLAVQGTIAIAKNADASEAALVELDTETDFVARGDAFINAAQEIANLVLAGPEGETPATPQITKIVDDLRFTTKENVSLGRAVKLSAPAGGKVGSYLHHNRQVGTLVIFTGQAADDVLLGLSQHVAAAVPTPGAVDEAGLPQDELEKARAEFVAEAQASGKPAEIATKMAEGKVRKWVDERTLLGQPYVRDVTGKTQVRAILPKGVTVTGFARYQVGVR